ncbi:PHO85 cyclin-like protein psl1 like [Verticillium longisporum]|nr:PHO85 cyclin-like protein psl1 like [Verticillium longisporum]
MEDDGESDESAETDSDLADDDDDDDETPSSAKRRDSEKGPIITGADPGPNIGPATYFVVDSFNIHRLIIAGVTCASKFFSDVFYTNSRYAKVGGLPLAELNHLELQFLLLNDFRLAVPVEDLEAYATMLVEFYAREVVVPQQSRPAAAAAGDA